MEVTCRGEHSKGASLNVGPVSCPWASFLLSQQKEQRQNWSSSALAPEVLTTAETLSLDVCVWAAVMLFLGDGSMVFACDTGSNGRGRWRRMSQNIQEAKNYMETPSLWPLPNSFWRNWRLLGLWGREKRPGNDDSWQFLWPQFDDPNNPVKEDLGFLFSSHRRGNKNSSLAMLLVRWLTQSSNPDWL